MIAKISLYITLFLCASLRLDAGGHVSGSSDAALPPHSLFGWAVSVQGEFAAISAPGERDNNLTSAGAVYIYRIHSGNWEFMQRIAPSDPSMMKLFGASIKIEGHTLIVGAPGDNAKTGAVYTYAYSGESWEAVQKLAPRTPVMFQGFGSNVDAAQGIVLISSVASGRNDSASGSVAIYNPESIPWKEEAVLTAPIKDVNDLFGSAAAILSSDHILISAPRADGAVEHSGAVYAFRRIDQDWKLTGSFASPYARTDGLFGCALSASSGRVLVGAMQEHVTDMNSGSAYIYSQNSDGQWTVESRIVPDTVRNQDYFGTAVSLDGEIAIVGSPKWDINKLRRNGDMGRVAVYARSDSGWMHTGSVIPEDGNSDDHFGMAIGMSGNELIVGSRLHDNAASNDGSAYFYRLGELFPALTEKVIPASFELSQNFPNPFISSTTIHYDLPERTHVTIEIFDADGRLIRQLVDQDQEAGHRQVTWNGRNRWFGVAQSGVYVYRITTPNFTASRKMVFVK
ncbi:MAG: T9SS type A sorting domain-containing protein [Bacteroidota bacterium]